jgi:hypothetical protein
MICSEGGSTALLLEDVPLLRELYWKRSVRLAPEFDARSFKRN